MNLKTLSSEAMLSNSQEWLSNPQVRVALEAHPLGAAILDRIQATHSRLSAAVSDRKRLDETVEQMTIELSETDSLHDRKARALSKLLDGLVEASDQPDTAEALGNARNLLFPDDLRITRRSYTDEHGAVVEMEHRVTPEIRQLLAATQVADTTLLAIYEQWVAAGMQLGELVKERARAESSVKRASVVPARIDTRGSRFDWIRTARVFLGIIDLLPLDDDQRRALLAPLEQDIARSLESRARSTSQGNDDDDDGDDSDEPGDEPSGETPDAPTDGGVAPAPVTEALQADLLIG